MEPYTLFGYASGQPSFNILYSMRRPDRPKDEIVVFYGHRRTLCRDALFSNPDIKSEWT